jgi:hypothetical protein
MTVSIYNSLSKEIWSVNKRNDENIITLAEEVSRIERKQVKMADTDDIKALINIILFLLEQPDRKDDLIKFLKNCGHKVDGGNYIGLIEKI